MKKQYRLGIIIFLFSFILVHSGYSIKNQDSFSIREHLFNENWKFIRDSVSGAERVTFDDTDWMEIDLPHDYSIMDLPGEDTPDQIGPFSKNSPENGSSTGHVLGGTGWYRKSFVIDKSDEGKTAVLKFDGVYMESEVWVNGTKAGTHKNGYTPFWFDITSLLNKPGEPNIVAVKVDNIGRNTRWYSGSGIYRNVYLVLTSPVHVGVWGTKITTPEINSNNALVEMEVTTENENESEVNAEITINIKDMDCNLVGTSTGDILLTANSAVVSKNQINVENPDLWSLEYPNLYTAEIIIKVDNKVEDIYNQTFGIRSIEFSAEKGFLLNGKPILLKGGCIHHDNGLLGSAAFERADERKVEILKANGFNAIRCAHNPYSEAFYDACDRLGMLVIDEYTDMWESQKNPNDYSRFFKEWWDKDMTNFILRDRNHPCIIMWSIGNEIYKKSIEDAVRIGTQLATRVRILDSSRPVTEAINALLIPGREWENSIDIFKILDVGGYNYLPNKYESDHLQFPDRVMVGTESFPNRAYEYWQAVEKYPYVIGDFVWTGMDHLGEIGIGNSNYVVPQPGAGRRFGSGRGAWPTYISWCGDIDITGDKKPQMLYRDVLWDNSKVEVNVHEPILKGFIEIVSQWGWPKEWPHWNWKGNEGNLLQVRVFTKASDVRLELNGEVIGKKSLNEDDKYIAVFEVPYEPGELTAIALENNEEVARKVLKTTGEPVAIRLIAERSEINADRNDLAYVKIEVVDESGQVVPTDSVKIQLSLEGKGELVASGNAGPDDMESFNKSVIKSYQGRAQAIIRPYSSAGKILLKAQSEGLGNGEVLIKTE
ncbi:glycoside hydrolase family 2 TIM barrel-domain containing protein [uncultured Draconibacterium sp.]|uniref:glycoside hydrolase family 2 TIM barrel-domain containing protein n=1 Tax=uncultured Draconibacterium sp. TaxID=1573823 RepID=UPI003216F10A